MSDQTNPTTSYPDRQSRLLWIPDGFDPRMVTDASIARYDDLILILIDRLVGVSIWRKVNPWISWSYKTLASHFGSRATWARIQPGFVKSDVIDRNEHFEVGRLSMRYRLKEPWNCKPIIPHEVHDQRLISRIDALRSSDISNWEPIHYYLFGNLRRVRIDEAKARSVIARLDDSKQWHANRVLRMLLVGDHRLKVDLYSRVHTLITSIPKGLRRLLTIDGQPLVEIDVSCCQPLLAGLITLEQARCKRWAISGESTRQRNQGKTLHPSLSIMSPNSGYPDISIQNSMLEDYIDACCLLDFYWEFAKVIKVPCGTDEERRKVKRMACYLIFGKTPKRGRPRFRQWERFCERWEPISDILDDLKRHDHRNAARKLQNYEAQLMITGVCGSLMRDHPDVPLLTVHDSILTTPEHADLVMERIGDVWETAGRRPKLKVTQ